MSDAGTKRGTTILFIAGLVASLSVAAYATVMAVSLQGDLDELRVAVGGDLAPEPEAEPGAGDDGSEPAISSSRWPSLSDRLEKTEAKVSAHEETIEELATIVAGLAGMEDLGEGSLEIGEDGEGSGPGVERLRAFLKKERMRERKEWFERSASKIDSVVATRHAEFIEAHGLDAEVDASLAGLEASVNDQIRTLADSVLNGEKMWFEARREARGMAADAFSRLDELLGPELADDYINRLAEDLPMLGRWRERAATAAGAGADG